MKQQTTKIRNKGRNKYNFLGVMLDPNSKISFDFKKGIVKVSNDEIEVLIGK